MNPKAAALVFLAVVASIALIVWLASRRSAVQAVRRRDLRLAHEALAAIEAEADRYDEIDSVLAAVVKDIVRNHRKEQRILG